MNLGLNLKKPSVKAQTSFETAEAFAAASSFSKDFNDKKEIDVAYFDRISNCKINYSIVYSEFLIHMLYPWSLFFIPSSNEKGGIRLMSLNIFWYFPMCMTRILFMYQYVSPFCIQFMIIYCIITNRILELFMPLVFYVIHKLMIALKYGSLTSQEYESLMTLKNDKTDLTKAIKYQMQLQLVSGWVEANPDVIESEIDKVSEYLGGNMETIEFTLNQNQLENWKVFFNSVNMNSKDVIRCTKKNIINNFNNSFESTENQSQSNAIRNIMLMKHKEDAVASINIKDVCMAMYKNATQIRNYENFVSWFCYITYLAVTIFLWVGAAKVGDLNDPIYIVFLITKTLINYLYFTIIMNFATTELVEFYRRLQLATMLGDIIRVTTESDNDIDLMNHINDCYYQVMSTLGSNSNDNNVSKIENKIQSSSNTLEIHQKINKSINLEKQIQKNKNETRQTLIIPSTPDNSSSNNGRKKKLFKLPKAWSRNVSESQQTIHRSTIPVDLSKVSDLSQSQGKDQVQAKELYLEEYRLSPTINESKYNMKREDVAGIPTVSLNIVSNISSWHYLREICLKLGGRYKMRMDIIAGFVTVFAIIILIMTLLITLGVLFSGSPIASFYLFIFAMLTVSIITITVGALTNYTYKMHRQILIFNSLRNESKSIWVYRQARELEASVVELEKIKAVSHIGNDDGQCDDSNKKHEEQLRDLLLALEESKEMIKKFNQSIESINTCNESLEVSNQLHPLRICGFTCDFAFVSSLITGTITVASTILQRIYVGD